VLKRQPPGARLVGRTPLKPDLEKENAMGLFDFVGNIGKKQPIPSQISSLAF
jgi:hypothetical protein